MTARRRIVVLATDSYFSAEAFRPIAQRYANDIVLVVLSRATTQSITKLWRIARIASLRYLWYRSTIQLIGATPLGRVNRIEAAAHDFGFPVVHSYDINATEEHARIAGANPEVGVALNFDQILPAETLALFEHGILNSHAGKLPADRGISPALWAFARGDDSIWLSIYKMDAGLDTGPVYRQEPIPAGKNPSAFSLYRTLSQASGHLLAETVGAVLGEGLEPQAQVGQASRPHSWPDRTFGRQLRVSKRRLITLADYRTLIRKPLNQ